MMETNDTSWYKALGMMCQRPNETGQNKTFITNKASNNESTY